MLRKIHREALAIIFCVTKFHQYLYGRRFVLRTDHKPLVSIFGPDKGIPTMVASRMTRWAIILSSYSYDIEYVRTDQNGADGLSRLPVSTKDNQVLPVQQAMLLDCTKVKRFTSRDPLLSKIFSLLCAQCEITNLKPLLIENMSCMKN